MKDYIKINRKVYDLLAEEYKLNMKDYIVSNKKLIKPFIDYLKDNFDKPRVLELGPGSGLCLSYFEKEGINTTAIDISKKLLSISKELAPKTKYILADFLEFDFGKSRFEGIFAQAVIQLFPKKDAIIVFRKIFDLLVDNGISHISTTIHEKSEEGVFEKLDYTKKIKRFRKKWTENELLEEVIKAGFSIYRKWYNSEQNKSKEWINLIIVKNSLDSASNISYKLNK